MTLAKRTSKNQITLPKKIVEALPADYYDVSTGEGVIILRPVSVEDPRQRLESVQAKIRELGLTESSVDDAIRWARGR